MYCKKCGTKLEDGFVCCPECGTFIDEEQKDDVEVKNEYFEGKQSNGFAIAGFITSFFVPILGWIFGGIGLKKSKELGGSGRRLAIAAIIIAVFTFIFNIIYTVKVMQNFEEFLKEYEELFENMLVLFR